MIWQLKTINQQTLNNTLNNINVDFLADRLAFNLNMSKNQLLSLINLDDIKYLISIILINRNIDYNILNNPQNFFINPNKLFNAYNAAININKYLHNPNAFIYIFADYDADGLTAGYVMKNALLEVSKCSIDLYYPNRCEGYGLNLDFCKSLVNKHNPNDKVLVITVDNGITKYKEVEYLNNHNIECIITDHHTSKKNEVPNCLVVDPFNLEVNQDNTYHHLSGCGVAFKVAQLVQELNNVNNMYKYLPYVAISIITDVMPMHTENLAILQYGLDIINSNNCPLGIKEYKNQENIDYMTTKDIGWTLGPMLNACGRMGDTSLGSKLFFGEEGYSFSDIVSKIKTINDKRKRETKKFTTQLSNMSDDNNSVFIWNINNITPGIVGIIAGKAVERFNKPSIIVTSNNSNNILHGSARTANNINLIPIMNILQKENLILQFGGHAEAIGLSFEEDKLSAIQKRLNELIIIEDINDNQDLIAVNNILEIDEYLSLDNLNVIMLALSNLLPIDGKELKEVVFAINNCEVKSFKTYPSGYMELTLKQGNTILDMSSMSLASKFTSEILPILDANNKMFINIAGTISKHFKTKKYVLNIIDIVV